jgi:hypothetical protein
MNALNRIVASLLLAAVAVVAVTTLLVLMHVARPEEFAVGPWLGGGLAHLAALAAPARWWAVAAAGGAFVVGIALLYLEIATLAPRQPPRLVLRQSGLGTVTVQVDGIRALASREAASVDGVRDARTMLRGSDDGLRLACRVAVDPHADLPALSRTVQERVRDAVQHHLGETVTEVSIDAQATPLPGSRAVRAR